VEIKPSKPQSPAQSFQDKLIFSFLFCHLANQLLIVKLPKYQDEAPLKNQSR
jgi:hypothetical protein